MQWQRKIINGKNNDLQNTTQKKKEWGKRAPYKKNCTISCVSCDNWLNLLIQ